MMLSVYRLSSSERYNQFLHKPSARVINKVLFQFSPPFVQVLLVALVMGLL